MQITSGRRFSSSWLFCQQNSNSQRRRQPLVAAMTKHKITHVVFDCDGLLVDTEIFYTTAQQVSHRVLVQVNSLPAAPPHTPSCPCLPRQTTESAGPVWKAVHLGPQGQADGPQSARECQGASRFGPLTAGCHTHTLTSKPPPALYPGTGVDR